MADLTRHVMQDAGVWKAGPGAWSSSMYRADYDPAHKCDPDAAVDLCTAGTGEGGFGHHAPWHCDRGSHMCECGDQMRCLTPLGVVFTIVCTYTGFACLLVGILWGVDLPRKLGAHWRALRG
mmetsp:Transcript_970/g.3135  ORF Transcript_970/g.3135 Transcript_970/m.3135 type:complete len:122 (-) Transcript_970:90-455(-)